MTLYSVYTFHTNSYIKQCFYENSYTMATSENFKLMSDKFNAY